MRSQQHIYGAGYDGSDQLEPADSLAGEIGQDPLDAGYSPPDREPVATRTSQTYAQEWGNETLDERLAEEEPEICDSDLDLIEQDARAGRLVTADTGDLADDDIATDVGYAGWAASAEEAAMHIISEPE